MDTEWNEEALEKERKSLNEMRDRMGHGLWEGERWDQHYGNFENKNLALSKTKTGETSRMKEEEFMRNMRRNNRWMMTEDPIL